MPWPVGRWVFLRMLGLGALGVVWGSGLQGLVDRLLSPVAGRPPGPVGRGGRARVPLPGRDSSVRLGKFNPGQKLFATYVAGAGVLRRTLSGMIRGRVPAEWARRYRPRWHAELAEVASEPSDVLE